MYHHFMDLRSNIQVVRVPECKESHGIIETPKIPSVRRRGLTSQNPSRRQASIKPVILLELEEC